MSHSNIKLRTANNEGEMVTGEEEKKQAAAEIMRKRSEPNMQVWLQTIVGTHLINVPVKYSDS